MAPANAEPTRGVIYADTVLASPARVAGEPRCRNAAWKARSRSCSAATCRRVTTPYTRDEVAAAVDACAAIEVVTSRYQDLDAGVEPGEAGGQHQQRRLRVWPRRWPTGADWNSAS